MTLRQAYDRFITTHPIVTPSKYFVRTLSEATGRSEKSIRNYISGCDRPPKHIQQIIADMLDSTPEELFGPDQYSPAESTCLDELVVMEGKSGL